MIPQITLIILAVLGLIISFANNGKPRSKENFLATLFYYFVELTILYYGGFFDPMIENGGTK
jgi:hypothetical protein